MNIFHRCLSLSAQLFSLKNESINLQFQKCVIETLVDRIHSDVILEA